MLDWDDLLEDFALPLVGLLVVAKLFFSTAWSLVVGFRAHVWSKWFTKDLIVKYGRWAVITGCSDGIGKAYAFQLAKAGMNVVLISRTLEKLEAVDDAIKKKYGVQTEIIAVDFSLGQEVYPEIERRLQGKEIGMLVNNVGVITPYPMKFGEVSDRSVWDHATVNVASPMAMTKIVLPQMLERRKGAIVNLASVAGRNPSPLLQIYAASKAFVDYFSEALGSEYAESGITVQTLTPSYISTNMTSYSEKIHKPSLFIPTPTTYAAHALDTLGYTNYTTGYWAHGILTWVLDNFIPRWMFMELVKRNNEELLQDMQKKKD